MATSSEVLHCYDRLASIVSRMLELAQARSWDQLPELENHCFNLVERLKVIEPVEALDALQRKEVRRLRVSIHDERDEVTRMIKPQLDRLMQKMARLHTQQGLHKAYGLAP